MAVAIKQSKKPVTREWLFEHYITKGMDTTQIGRIVNRDPKSVWTWLKDFGIPTRPRGSTTANTRFKKGHKSRTGIPHTAEMRRKLSELAKADGRVPYNRATGPWMKGRCGALHPRWKGGFSPERATFYGTKEWINAAARVKKRDKHTCQLCLKTKVKGDGVSFDIHHIVGFACITLRCVDSNLVYLCEACHYWIHGKENVHKILIKEAP